MPYREDFETYEPGSMPKYFDDLGGCFEVVRACRRQGAAACARSCPRKASAGSPVPTRRPRRSAATPRGGITRSVPTCSSRRPARVCLFGRVAAVKQDQKPPCGYWLKVDQAGKWELVQRQEAAGRRPDRLHRRHLAHLEAGFCRRYDPRRPGRFAAGESDRHRVPCRDGWAGQRLEPCPVRSTSGGSRAVGPSCREGLLF